MSNSLQFSVDDGFALLAHKLELPLNEYTAIASRQAEIEAYLGQYISTFTTVLPGAFARKTLVSPLAGCSIDMYILFKQEHSSRFTPADLLDKLLVTLKHRYENTAMSAGSAAVIIPFEHFQFRLQPGFLTETSSYLVPAQNLTDWANFDSLGYKAALAKANSTHKGRLTPLIRMLKSWNHLSGNYFEDYYLELLVKDVMTDYTIDSYPRALCYIFRAGMLETAYKKQDPANLEFEIEGLRDIENLVKAMLHFQKAYKLARYALEYQTVGDVEMALENWRAVLPGCFPSALELVIGRIKNLGIKGIEALKLMQDVYNKP